MKPTLQLRQSLQLTMTPQLQQAIKLLQMSSLDLQTEIQQVLESNPMLELNEEEVETPASHENLEWQGQLQSLKPAKKSSQDGQNIESIQAAESTLTDYLLWQMDLTPFSQTDRFIAENIIEAVNEDGFIQGEFSDIVTTIQSQSDIDEDEIIAVLKRIQLFDPIGVAARNLRETLLVQLSTLPEETALRPQAILCVEQFLPLLAKHDHAQLKRKLKISPSELRHVIQMIQNLNPRPGSLIGSKDNEYIIPDVFVHKFQEHWVVEINPDCIPKIRLNGYYSQLPKQVNRDDSQYIRTQLQEARWFLKSIENRNDTLLRVSQCIVDAQADFLEHGEEKMKPMVLHDIAEKVSMHESTISRVTTQKFIHTPRGTFELKYFFSSALNTDSGGECSSTAIRALIKKLVEQEDHQKPLSDNKLAENLCKQGIQVARRTVAKYRENMNIPPSHERKQL